MQKVERIQRCGEAAAQRGTNRGRTVAATFGSDDVAVIGVRSEDVFAARTLEKIARVTSGVAAIPGVERVLSLANTPDPPPTCSIRAPSTPPAAGAAALRRRGRGLESQDSCSPAVR